jgi:hypothetical protein
MHTKSSRYGTLSLGDRLELLGYQAIVALSILALVGIAALAYTGRDAYERQQALYTAAIKSAQVGAVVITVTVKPVGS